MAGEVTKNSIDLMANALSALAVRARVQEPFTPDLQGAVEPIAKALETVTGTFAKTASAQLEVSSEAVRASADEALGSIGAPDLLQAAVAVGQVPSGGNVFRSTTVERRSGAVGIPWLELLKEIINLVIKYIPGLGRLAGIISEILEFFDKIFGGQRHLQEG